MPTKNIKKELLITTSETLASCKLTLVNLKIRLKHPNMENGQEKVINSLLFYKQSFEVTRALKLFFFSPSVRSSQV